MEAEICKKKYAICLWYVENAMRIKKKIEEEKTTSICS